MADALLMTGQVARLAGVSEVTVREWTRQGRLACSRTNSGMRLYDPQVVCAFIVNRLTAASKCDSHTHVWPPVDNADADRGRCLCGAEEWHERG